MKTYKKIGRISFPNQNGWSKHGFMTPTPLMITDNVIRVYGGVRDDQGISRIAFFDVHEDEPLKIINSSFKPVLDLGDSGMFDDNGVILGDVIRISEKVVYMYYVGFQLCKKAKFIALSGLAISNDNGLTFQRYTKAPILGRFDQAEFISAIHSIFYNHKEKEYYAYVSCGDSWETINNVQYPRYKCFLLKSIDGIAFDTKSAINIVSPINKEYRIGRPRISCLSDGSYELRTTSDTLDKNYSSQLFLSTNGVDFERQQLEEIPKSKAPDWDSEMVCYPSKITTTSGYTYIFYNGNGMGMTGTGVAVLD